MLSESMAFFEQWEHSSVYTWDGHGLVRHRYPYPLSNAVDR